MLFKGSEILIKALEDEGVEHLFGYPGGAVLNIYDTLYENTNLKHILVRHEQAAAHAADGYARSTGKVGVCLATSGPGATNLVTGLATAHLDSAPIVAITGQANTDAIGKDSFQEADMFGITLPITKHSFLVKEVSDLAKTIREAFCLAHTGRPGPVLVNMPKDITTNKSIYEYGPCSNICQNSSNDANDEELGKNIAAALDMIKFCKKPVIIAGGGVSISDACQKLYEFANAIQSPVTTTLMGLGVFDASHELNLGMPGMHGTAYANYCVHDSDLLIGIGMRFDDRVTAKLSTFAPSAKIIHIDIDPAEIDKSVQTDISIIGDAKLVLETLLTKIKENNIDYSANKGKWIDHIKELKKSYPLSYEYDQHIIKPQYILEELNSLKSDETIIVTDVGKHQMWSAQFLDYKLPKTFITSGGLGTMGFGLPAAIGAQVANPNKQVINITGDGSIQMNIQELSTVAYYKLPVKIFIMNNSSLGMVRQWQDLFLNGRFSYTNLEGMTPDFIKLAHAYDIMALSCEKPQEVKSTLEKALAHVGPVIVDFKVDKNENVFPIVPPGGVLNKMIFGPPKSKSNSRVIS